MDDDYDLDAAWEEVLKSFEKTARVKLKPDKLISPQDVIDQLSAAHERNEDDKRRHRRLKKALARTLECIKNFGMLAAQDQSQVLGPSNLVYAAIVMLIQAGTAYSMIFERLEELFKIVADILERFDVYRTMRVLDLPLRKILHSFLQSIVQICALSMKVLNGSKLSKYLKVLAFSEDEGVRQQLALLRKNLEKEAMMVTTLSYRSMKEGFETTADGISGVQKAVTDLTENIIRKDTESADQRQMATIKAALGVQDSNARQESIREHWRSEAVEGMGDWLIADEDCEDWSDSTQVFTDVLLLSGDQGYGKTFLCARVVNELLKRTNQSLITQSSRTTVGFYFVQANDSTGRNGHDDELFSVERILKSIALQFCHDLVYRKHLAALCEAWIEPDNPVDLCRKLLDQCYQGSETFFIVMDGIDRANDKQLNSLVSLLGSLRDRFTVSQRSRVRILLSGRTKVIEELERSLEKVETSHITINVESRTLPDIKLFVQDQLANNMTLLAGDSVQLKQLRAEIFETLTTLPRDFVNLSLLLKEMSAKTWPAEIRQVLDSAKSSGQRSDTIDREVARCNSALTPQEVRDLNALLLWVTCSRRTLRVSELEAVLFMANGEAPLRSLRDQLAKYSAFFHVFAATDTGPETNRGWLVSLSSESIRQYFLETSRQDDLSTMSSSKVQENEVKIVRRFLASVCDDELYTKFGFAEFFARKLNNLTTFVHVDIESAPCTLLVGCLQAMTDSREETKELIDYAANFFSRHMAEIDLAMTSPIRKFEVGRYLLPLLTNAGVIERWIQPQTKELVSQLFFSDEIADLIVVYIRDTAVSKSFAEERKEWIRNLSSTDVLGEVVKFLSLQLFGSSAVWGWDYKLLFSLLQAYKSKVDNHNHTTVHELKNFEVDAKTVVSIFIWAAEVNSMNMGKDYEWNRGLARMLRLFGNIDASIAQYQIACTLKDDAWLAQYGLAQALMDKEEYSAAVELFKEVERNIADGTAKDNNPTSYIRSIRFFTTQCYRRSGKLNEALLVFEKHLKESEIMDYDFQWACMEIWHDQKRFTKITDTFQKLHESIDPYFGIRRTSRLLHWMSDTGGTMEELLVAAYRETGNRPYYTQLLEEAIKDTYKPNYLNQFPQIKAEYRAYLRLALSEEMWRTATSQKTKDDTVTYCEDVLRDSIDVDVTDVYVQVAKRLAQVYTEQLRQYTPDAPEVKALAQRITDLATKDHNQQDAWTSTVNTTLLMARYHSVQGNVEEARKLARASVKIGLELLSDSDPDNDWEAFQRLALVLMYCGDDADALASWSLLLPRQGFMDIDKSKEEGDSLATAEDESTKSEGSDDSRGKRKLEGNLQYFCDGYCGVEWTFGDDIYVCKDCLDVMFCAPCHERLHGDELGENVCGPKHEHLHVPSFDADEAQARGKTNVRYKDEVVPVSEWLDHLRNEWKMVLNDEEILDDSGGRSFSEDYNERSRLKLQSLQKSDSRGSATW